MFQNLIFRNNASAIAQRDMKDIAQAACEEVHGSRFANPLSLDALIREEEAANLSKSIVQHEKAKNFIVRAPIESILAEPKNMVLE
jgi:hypothetical protein